MDSEKLPPIHPGEILSEEFLIPLGMSQKELAHTQRLAWASFRLHHSVARTGTRWDVSPRRSRHAPTGVS